MPHLALSNYPLSAVAAESDSDYEMLYVPSVNMLRQWLHRLSNPSAEVGRSRFVGVADSCGDLPGAVEELDGILPFVGNDAVVLKGSAATLDMFREACAGAAVIHIAVHGIYLPDDPIGSGLLFHLPEGVTPSCLKEWEASLLAKSRVLELPLRDGGTRLYYSGDGRSLTLYKNRYEQIVLKKHGIPGIGAFVEVEGAGGQRLCGQILQARDIPALIEPTGAIHVTLSCCRSGYTNSTDAATEYIGIVRGFLEAGASSVVANPWPVPDTITAELMRRYYSNVAGLHGSASMFVRAAALRRAQRELNSGSDSRESYDGLLARAFVFYGIG